MKTSRLYIMVAFVLMAAAGFSQAVSAADDSGPLSHAPRVIVLGIDSTGSYNLWEPAKKLAYRIIGDLSPGDVFYCRVINDQSYTDQASIFKLQMPEATFVQVDSPFDRKAKNHNRRQRGRLIAVKKAAITRFQKVAYEQAGETDIDGFLMAASDRFLLYPKDRERFLLIASDLADNVHYSIKPDLSGVRISIIGFQVSKSPTETKRRKDKWLQKFREAGADSVKFLAMEEAFSLNR